MIFLILTFPVSFGEVCRSNEMDMTPLGKVKGHRTGPDVGLLHKTESLIVNLRLQKDVLSNLPASTGASVKWAEGKWGGEASFQTRPALSPASVLLTTSLATPLPASDTQCTRLGHRWGRGVRKRAGRSQWPGTNRKVKGRDFCWHNRLIWISSFCFYLVFESTILVSFSP